MDDILKKIKKAAEDSAARVEKEYGAGAYGGSAWLDKKTAPAPAAVTVSPVVQKIKENASKPLPLPGAERKKAATFVDLPIFTPQMDAARAKPRAEFHAGRSAEEWAESVRKSDEAVSLNTQKVEALRAQRDKMIGRMSQMANARRGIAPVDTAGSAELAEISKEIARLEAEGDTLAKNAKTNREALTATLMRQEGYRKASFGDVTAKSAQRGWYNSLYGLELHKKMLGQKNYADYYENILNSDDYKFIPTGPAAEALSGAAELGGQMARSTVANPYSAAYAAAYGGMAAMAGSAVPLPEEVITVPMAMAAGVMTGAALDTYQVESGLAWKEMIDNGISPETAKNIALLVGGANALLEVVQLDDLTDAWKILKKSPTLSKGTFAQKLFGLIKEQGKHVVTETAQEVGQEGITIGGTQLASRLDKGTPAYSDEEIRERIGDTIKSSATSFALMGLPGAVKNAGSLAIDHTIDHVLDPAVEDRSSVIDREMPANKKATSTKVVLKLAESIPLLENDETVYHATGEEFAVGEKKLSEQVYDFFRKIGNFVHRKGFGDVVLDEKGVDSSIAHGMGRAKAIAFSCVPDVIKKGRQIDYQEKWKGRNYDSYMFAAPVQMGAKKVYVAAVVSKSRIDNRYYLHEVVDSEGNIIKIKKDDTSFKSKSETNESPLGEVSSDKSIPHPAPDVNRKNIADMPAAVAESGTLPIPADRDVSRAGAVFGENGARAFREGYTASVAWDVPVAEAKAGFAAVYSAALEGRDMTSEEKKAARNLPASFRAAAVEAARADAKRAEGAAYYGTASGIDRTNAEYKRAKLSRRDEKVLDAIGKALGVKVRFAEDLRDADGKPANAQYADGVLSISLSAENPVRVAFTHEAVHRLREVSPEAYRALAEFVQTNMSAETLTAYEDATARDYGNDIDTVSEEIVAEAFAELMGNRDLLDRFCREHLGAARTLRDIINDLIAKIKRVFSKDDAAFSELHSHLQEMERTLTAALSRAAYDVQKISNGQQKNTDSRSGVVKSQIRSIPGTNKRYVYMDRQIKFGSDMKANEKWIKDFIDGAIRRGEDIVIPTIDGHNIIVTDRSSYEISNRRISGKTGTTETLIPVDKLKVKYIVAAHLDEIIQIAKKEDYSPDKTGAHQNDVGEDGFNYFTSWFAMPRRTEGGKIETDYYRITFSAGLNGADETMYGLNIPQKRSTPPQGYGSSENRRSKNKRQSASDDIISQEGSGRQEEIYSSSAEDTSPNNAFAVAMTKAEREKAAKSSNPKSSRKGVADAYREVEALKRENERLQRDAEMLRDAVHGGKPVTVRKESISRLSKRLHHEWNIDRDPSDATAELEVA